MSYFCFVGFAGITVQDNTMFLTNHKDNRIYMASTDGTDVTAIANSNYPWPIVLDRYEW